jgi:hypothetical protein
MTPTEILYARLAVKPKCTLLLGDRSLQDFMDAYHPNVREVLKINELSMNEIEQITHFSSLAPRGDYRLICIGNLCSARKDVQATLLKLIEDSPERSHWVLSVVDKSRILAPLISRAFIVDWINLTTETKLFTAELKELINNKNYLDIFKLHKKISQMAGKNEEQVKSLHLDCINELMCLLPVEAAVKVQKHQKEIANLNKTETSFKTALLEVLS